MSHEFAKNDGTTTRCSIAGFHLSFWTPAACRQSFSCYGSQRPNGSLSFGLWAKSKRPDHVKFRSQPRCRVPYYGRKDVPTHIKSRNLKLTIHSPLLNQRFRLPLGKRKFPAIPIIPKIFPDSSITAPSPSGPKNYQTAARTCSARRCDIMSETQSKGRLPQPLNFRSGSEHYQTSQFRKAI